MFLNENKRYWIAPISGLILVYISAHRFFSIKFPKNNFFTKDKRNNLIFIALLLIYNGLFYSPVFIFSGFVRYENALIGNSTNTTYRIGCSFLNTEYMTILALMDLINSALIPFILMTIFSILLIAYIFKIRQKISSKTKLSSASDKKKFKKDIKFSLTIISLNVLFLVLNVPTMYVGLIELNNLPLKSFINYLYYASYGCNFYVLVLSNSLFRSEFLQIFQQKKIHQKTSSNQ